MTECPQLVLDHAVVNTATAMDEMAALYRRLGFALTPRGHHTLGSINHLAVFGENYLELLGFPEAAATARPDLMGHPRGLTGLAFRTPDAKGLHARLAAAGEVLTDWRDFSRPVEIEGREEQAAFRTFQLDPEDIDNGRIFFCEQKTPQLIWRAAFRGHPNGARDIVEFTLASDAPEALAARLAAVPGLGAPRPLAGGGVALRAGVAQLRLIPFAGLAAGFGPGSLPGAPGRLRMAGLGFVCPDLGVTAACLEAGGVPFRRGPEAVVVAPEHAGGLWLRFLPARR